MATSPRIDPLGRLLASRLRPLDTEPWLGRLPADPVKAWNGRIRLDRARVQDRPDDADAWWRLAVGLHAVGRHEDASAGFLRALRRDLHACRGPAVLLLTDREPQIERVLEFVEATRVARRVAVFWVATRPVTFDRALGAATSLEGRAYRIGAELLQPVLASDAVSGVRHLVTHDAEWARLAPPSVRTARLPRDLVEDAPHDAEAFDALLCPTRPSARAWSDTEGRVVPIRWPGAVARSSSPAKNEIVLALRAPAGSDAAWDDATLHALLHRLVLEIPDRPVTIVPASSRRHQAVGGWKRWRGDAPADARDRVRIAFAPDLSMPRGPGAVVIAEPDPRAWVPYLRDPLGLLVLDPGHVASSATPTTVDRVLKVVERVHAHARDPVPSNDAREAARADVFFSAPAPPLAEWFDGGEERRGFALGT